MPYLIPRTQIPNPKCRAFTLVELLVVIAIIGILVSLLLPAVQSAREAARRLECKNNLKQIGLAMHNYLTANGTFPYGSADHDWEGAPYDPGSTFRTGGNWRTMILPFIEQTAVHDRLSQLDPRGTVVADHTSPWAAAPEQLIVIPGYVCPSEVGRRIRGGVLGSGKNEWGYWNFGPKNDAAISTYMGCAGPASTGPLDWGIFQSAGLCTDGSTIDALCPCTLGNSSQFDRGFYHGHNPNGPGMLDMYPNGYDVASCRDGTSNTLLVGETHGVNSNGDGCGDQLNWMSTWAVSSTVYGINANNVGSGWGDGCNFRSYHPGGASFVFVDGSVHFLSETIDLWTFGYLGARNDGEVVSDF